MKILSQLWKVFKGEAASPNGLGREWIVHQAKWDPERKLYIVGNLSPSTEVDPKDPKFATVDSYATLPPNWHQCFYYYEEPANTVTGGISWRRCRNLAGPGLKPSFCLLHAEQEAALHRKTETEKKQNLVESNDYNLIFCRHGSCVVHVSSLDEYCKDHIGLYKPNQSVMWESEEDCGCYGYCEKHFNKGEPRTQEQIEWDAITEEVDWAYINRIGWTELKFRQNRKGLPVQAQETVHFKLELRGSRDDIDLFHAILHLCDSDYPLDPFRKNTKSPEQCKNCNGYVWTNAIVTPVDIKKAARQAGITVKVRFYFPESTCKKKDRTTAATA